MKIKGKNLDVDVSLPEATIKQIAYHIKQKDKVVIGNLGMIEVQQIKERTLKKHNKTKKKMVIAPFKRLKFTATDEMKTFINRH